MKTVAPSFTLSIMDVQFYNYQGERLKVGKPLENPVTLTGYLRDTYNVLTPVLTIRHKDGFTYNYVYIPVFGRYYFVDGYTVANRDEIILSLKVDVLETYKDVIRAATGTVTESDNANKHVSNRETIYNTVPTFEKLEFPNTDGLTSDNASIIMITVKGNV